MNAADFGRVRAAFEAALEHPPGQRAAALAAAFPDEPELAREARRMLAGHATDEAFLDPPGDQTLGRIAASGTSLEPGAQVGEFVLLRWLGGGGMGDVWEAEQTNPKRRVALKTLRAGFANDRERRRFEDEALHLARLDHPGIARIYASGMLPGADATPPRPWFAMELIEDARSLTKRGRELPLRGRLLLLKAACDAVHHGHLRGIVHRDLKPANVLVDADDRVRVIDFGIARASGAEQPVEALTVEGELVGTIAYMAPEQVQGASDRIDVRTDVHALGVLLYELLTDRSPWTKTDSSWAALAREVLDADPAPPSRVVKGLSRELDWIVARALAKDPQRRYASAQDLSLDLGRFLDDEPLAAGPPSKRYQARKFVRRHRGAVVGSLVALVLLVLGSAGTGYGLWKSLKRGKELEVARAEAVDKAERALALNAFLESMLRASNPMGAMAGGDGEELTVAEMLDRAASGAEEAFADRPELEAETRLLLGVAYHGQGRIERAHDQLERARTLLRAAGPSRIADTVRADRMYATALSKLNEEQRALEILRASWAEANATLEADDPERAAQACDLAWLLAEIGRLEESVPYAQAALDGFELLGAEYAQLAAVSASNLARSLRSLGDNDATEQAYRRALARMGDAWGEQHPNVGIAANNLGSFLFSAGRHAEAVLAFEQAIEILEATLPGDHPILPTLLYNLANALQQTGRLEDSMRVSRQCLELLERTKGPDHEDTAEARNAIDYVLYAMGQFDAAAEGHAAYASFLRDRRGPSDAAARRAEIRAAQSRDSATAPEGEALEALYAELVEALGPDHELVRYVVRAASKAFEGCPAPLARWKSRE